MLDYTCQLLIRCRNWFWMYFRDWSLLGNKCLWLLNSLAISGSVDPKTAYQDLIHIFRIFTDCTPHLGRTISGRKRCWHTANGEKVWSNLSRMLFIAKSHLLKVLSFWNGYCHQLPKHSTHDGFRPFTYCSGYTRCVLTSFREGSWFKCPCSACSRDWTNLSLKLY